MSEVQTPLKTKSSVALRAFFLITDHWQLERSALPVLLGVTQRSIDRWKSDASSADLSRDQLERISYLLGIYAGLRSLMSDPAVADGWVNRPNLDFGSDTPLKKMLGGNVGDLYEVRRYVDTWRNVW